MIIPTFRTRTIGRAAWKAIWRQLRIINREAMKAALDAALYGTGFVELGADVPDLIRRLEPANVVIQPCGALEVRP